ncbi:MAG: DNA repair protein [Candidatus Methanomethylicota archaeon]|uniref:DNA repair protein n=1 Tax=Thermoproteota archaeon TaxID=2056631 RepID=A0A497EK81_9CREN|nr:MAG: DNA repair protein [Candidatus Verstraetearchaeota archaeon]
MIYVDDREPEEICEMLSNLGIEFHRKRLEVGDYLIKYGSFEVAVERKDIRDYVSSLIDGRLFNQCYALSTAFDKSFIFIIGDFDEVADRIDKKAFIGSLVSIALREGDGKVFPIQVKEDVEFCLALKFLNSQIESGRIKAIPRAKKARDAAVAMLMAIPGVGEERAKRLLERFGSVWRIVNASVTELMRVEGIGEKQAKRIYDFVRGRKVR